MKSYPSILGLHHKYVKDILTQPVVIQEKVDGSQFSFWLDPLGMPVYHSRKTLLHPGGVGGNFGLAVQTVDTLIPLLREGWVYRAEAITRPKHNVLKYDRIPKGGLILFDVEKPGGEYLDPFELAVEAGRLELEVVPVFFYSLWEHFAKELEQFVGWDSILGGCKVEGIVIKSRVLKDPEGQPLMAKLVRDDFKEAHKREFKVGPDIIQKIVEALLVERRWEKAVERLRDADALVNAPQDIGPLLKEIHQDVLKEETEWMKDKLFEYSWKQIARGITTGFPEWYKERIREDDEKECSSSTP